LSIWEAQMKRVLFTAALVAATYAFLLLPGSGAADLGTPVILSCSDGHSVPLTLDTTGLTSLTTDVQAINASGTGTSCAVDTSASAASTSAPTSATANWTVYDYNPSGQAIYPRNSPNSHPATTTGTTTTFDFLYGQYTALLTTNDKALTGDLSTTTLNDTVNLPGTAPSFETQHNDEFGCPSNKPARVRFFFTAPSASGGGTQEPGFYTATWWSNPVHADLIMGDQPPMTLTADMSDPNEWSDWNGQPGTARPTQFNTAIHNVQSVGLSFGGVCFFETGVKADYTDPPPPYQQFSSNFTESP